MTPSDTCPVQLVAAAQFATAPHPMHTRDAIERFLRDQQIHLPVRDFVELVSNIYHRHESQQYDASHFSIELAIPHWRRVLDDVDARLATTPTLRLLDFGCGTGFATERVLHSSLRARCAQIVCYDLSPAMIDVCRTKFSAVPNVTYLSDREGFEALQQDAGRFDVIVCNSLVHHVLDHEELFDLYCDALTDDGLLIIGHEPNRRFYGNGVLQRVSGAYRVTKKIAGRVTRAASADGAPRHRNIAQLTCDELKRTGVVSDRFPCAMIQKFVDIHVPMSTLRVQPWGELGFDPAFFAAVSCGRFRVLQERSYNHIKDQQAYKSAAWRAVASVLQSMYPADGADAIFVLGKETSVAAER